MIAEHYYVWAPALPSVGFQRETWADFCQWQSGWHSVHSPLLKLAAGADGSPVFGPQATVWFIPGPGARLLLGHSK